MTVFLGTLGLLLGLMVMLAGAITFVRGLPDGVRSRPGQSDPRGNLAYLVNQQCLGLGVALLALDVVLRLAGRPFLLPGLVLLAVPVGLFARRQWRTRPRTPRRTRAHIRQSGTPSPPRPPGGTIDPRQHEGAQPSVGEGRPPPSKRKNES